MHFYHPPFHNLPLPAGGEAQAPKGGDDTFRGASRSTTPVRGARSKHFNHINNMASDSLHHHRRGSSVHSNNNNCSSNNNDSNESISVSARLKRDSNTSFVHKTAVAIDKDKHSPHAVCWAIDHLLTDNPAIILIHVKSKNSQHHGGSEKADANVRELFLLYRGYCARKRVHPEEVVVEENDVPKALLEFVANNYISNLVLGAASRKSLARKLKTSDVSTTVMKSAPDFCNVYVITKGRVSSARQARRTVMNTATPPRMPSPIRQLSPPLSPTADYFELADSARGRRRSLGPEMLSTYERMRIPVSNLSVDSIDINFGMRSPSRDSVSDLSDISNGRISFESMDMNDPNYIMGSESPANPAISHSSRELEAEMKRLKLELKQTMEMYSTACKEAISAKRKAEELHQLKMEELRRFEEARHAEETALAIAEMEKAKCKAALEAAEKAQKLAEAEAQRRKQAELKARKEARERDRALTVLHQKDVRYRKYTIYEIEEATDKFAKSNKIGEGGYGPVYKGTLDHTPVAIKVLRPDAAQGKKQFHQEVEVLSCMRHPNMVLLLGACPEYGCLVYEYMDFGSLEDRLLRKGNTPPISLRKRFEIAAEIATALLYLHQAKPEPLVHRDLKPANILLDKNYKSRISDVGLARLVPPSVADSVTQYHMTSAAGTFCYIDPEYQQTGKLTTRSDVYSLGILLLQIITAKPPMGLSHHVLTAINNGTFEDMLDPAIQDWPMEESLAFAKLALKCCELRKRDRPDLTTVVPELNRLREFGRNTDAKGDNDHTYHHRSSSAHASPVELPSPTSTFLPSSPSQATTHTGEGSEAEHM